MTDRLTQLQDAVDQVTPPLSYSRSTADVSWLANQFVASLFYVHKHHDYQTLGPNDTVRQEPKGDVEGPPKEQDVTPYPAEVFKDGQRELAQDLILKEQQIEFLISSLPGLGNSEKDQEQVIKQLEEELKVAEEERKQAVKEKEVVLARLEEVIRSVKRP